MPKENLQKAKANLIEKSMPSTVKAAASQKTPAGKVATGGPVTKEIPGMSKGPVNIMKKSKVVTELKK